MKTEKVNLAKLLKVKNRTASALAKTQTELRKWNSRDVGNSEAPDVAKLVIDYQKYTDNLVVIKSALSRANVGIVDKIFMLSEVKSQMQLIESLTVKKGDYKDYHDRVITYTAEIDAEKKAKLLADLVAKANKLQDEIDEHNATHKVELPSDLIL